MILCSQQAPHDHSSQIHLSEKGRTCRNWGSAEQRHAGCGWDGPEQFWDPAPALPGLEGGPEWVARFSSFSGLKSIVKSHLSGHRGSANSCCSPLATLMRWVPNGGCLAFYTGSVWWKSDCTGCNLWVFQLLHCSTSPLQPAQSAH